ncbi:type II toxin-antitoxin system RelE/ParE family toxin [Ensifer sp. NBAIM29]|nr:type II toxin-antitoxin system RelE/ParE family toxin [Ensifer sp. NBAIM29]
MMRVILSRSAASYLRQETRYLKSKNPSAAKRFTNAINEARQNLARFPDIGTEEFELPVPGARTWVIGDYLLDYVQNGDRIEIITIRHGRMKPLTPDVDVEDDFDADIGIEATENKRTW